MSKKKMIIGSIIGVLALVYVGCANTATEEQADIDTTVAIADANVVHKSAKPQKGNVGWPNSEGGYIPNNTHGWPVISGYVGTGEGPGEAWVGSFNYRDNTEAANHADADDPDSNQWDWVVIVTASNGVKVKCFELTNANEYLVINDGSGKDLEPNSPWMQALREIEAGGDAETINYWNSGSGAKLPATSVKRTSIDPNEASIVAFKQTFETHAKKITADAQLITTASGFQFIDANYNTFWSITYDGSEWVVRLNSRPATRSWEAMKEILHYISPDGDALYEAIYDDFYVASYDNPIEAYDSWWPCGNSQIYTPDLGEAGYCEYLIK
ncbi:MAG: hypothetical protein E7309_02655 [Butyrivibrio sp.]|nr:hypothetical protein [Butyrivibrio sp.]